MNNTKVINQTRNQKQTIGSGLSTRSLCTSNSQDALTLKLDDIAGDVLDNELYARNYCVTHGIH